MRRGSSDFCQTLFLLLVAASELPADKLLPMRVFPRIDTFSKDIAPHQAIFNKMLDSCPKGAGVS